MQFKTVDKQRLISRYNHVLEEHVANENLLNPLELELRTVLMNKYNECIDLIQNEKYRFDVLLGMELYLFLTNHTDNFSPLLESNYDFWRYVAVYIIPEIVGARWGFDNMTHFYTGAGHIYPNQIYWYIKLSWQGTIENTFEILKDNTTDEIMNLVDRTGKIGINSDLYRYWMKVYSTFPKNKRIVTKNVTKNISLFRAVCIKNTLKSTVIVPEIYKNGYKGYVDMLFEDFNYLKEN